MIYPYFKLTAPRDMQKVTAKKDKDIAYKIFNDLRNTVDLDHSCDALLPCAITKETEEKYLTIHGVGKKHKIESYHVWRKGWELGSNKKNNSEEFTGEVIEFANGFENLLDNEE